MAIHDGARPALDPHLLSVLDDLELSAADSDTPFEASRTPWRVAADAALLRYYDWALVERAQYAAFVADAEARAVVAGNARRAIDAADRKQRRIARAEKEGRKYKTRPYQSLRDMSAEDRAARRREQNRINQRRRRNGPTLEDHPLHGRFF